MSNRLILVGAGGFGRELINWAADLAAVDNSFEFFGFLDDNSQAFNDFSYDLPWLGNVESYNPQPKDRFIIAIGNPETKKKVVECLKNKGAIFNTLIHPTAVIAKSAKIGEGVVICPLALVSADAVISDFVAINALSSAGHDVIVGQYSTLSAHVDLTGSVVVEDLVFFGTGAKVLPKVKIARAARIGAGAVIMRNVKEGAVMYAPPAKRF